MSGNWFRMFTEKAVLVDQNRPGRLVTRHSRALDIVTQTMGSYAFPRDGGHFLCRYGCMARKASREAVPSHDDAPGIEKQVIIFNARPDVEPVNEG